jgi:Xaa-Pro dipeptidase
MKLTRRSWLASAGAAAAVLSLPASALEAAGSPPPLPPPLSPDVFRERQARLRAAAKSASLDALFVTPSTDLAYACNLAIGSSERLTALLLFSGGPSVLLTPAFEADNHRRDAIVDEIVTWKEEEDPIAAAAKRLEGAKAIGVEGSAPYATVTRLLEAASLRAEDASPLFETLRMIKSPQEQEFLREAARRTSLAIAASHGKLARGMRESQAELLLEREFERLGVRGGGLVQFGPSSAFPHGTPGDRRLEIGDAVLIDAGCRVRGYTSDITRTVAFGPPSDELRKVYGVVDRAQKAGIEALRAGATGEEVDAAARKVVQDAGYGSYFTHRLGHGLGLDGHERPYLVSGNAKALAAGNTVTIEPGVYLPDRFGIRIEDDYAVRDAAPAAGLSTRPGDLTILSR